MIDVFAADNIPIRTIDRSSGIIVTDRLFVPGRVAKTYAGCGMVGGETVVPSAALYNILVRGDSTNSMVRVTVRWVDERRECNTTGVFESGLEAKIKATAEREGHG